MGIQKTSDYASFLDPAASEIFYSGLISALESGGYTQWTDVREAPSLTIEAKGMAGIGAYTAHTEGNDHPQNAYSQSFNKTFTLAEFSNGIEISSLAAHFWDSAEFARCMSQMGMAAGAFLNAQAYGLLVNGFSAGPHAGPDGQSLFAGNHGLAAGTASNVLETDLSHSTLSTGFQVMRKQVTHNGLPAPAVPAFLIVPPELELTAKQLAGSQYTSDELQINALGPSLTVIVSAEISDADSWFLLAAPGPGGSSFINYLAKGPSPRTQVDDQSDNVQVVDRVITSNGFLDWRGAVGSAGAA
jgi:hypothetical protein